MIFLGISRDFLKLSGTFLWDFQGVLCFFVEKF